MSILNKVFWLWFGALFTISLSVNAQSISRQSLNPSGNSHQNEDVGYISWTLGQLEQYFQPAPGGTIYPGFQQGDLQVVSSSTEAGFASTIKVYPNPVRNQLHVISQAKSDLSFHLWSAAGQLIFNGTVIPGDNTLDMVNIGPGYYTLSIYDDANKSRTFKILKQ